MLINPQVYGISLEELELDPMLVDKRKELIISAATTLDRAKMLRYNERTGNLSSTDTGRTASHFYITYDSVEIFNKCLKPSMNGSEIFQMISDAKEFDQIRDRDFRDNEFHELHALHRKYCRVEIKLDNPSMFTFLERKVNVLLQTYIGRATTTSPPLISDLLYISQNVTRIARALFDMALHRNYAKVSSILLELCKMCEMTQWSFESGLRQFPDVLSPEIIHTIEENKIPYTNIIEMGAKELGILLGNQNEVAAVKKCTMEIPYIETSTSIQSITRTILKMNVELFPNFEWNDEFHGLTAVAFWIWLEDLEKIFRWKRVLITKNQVIRKETYKFMFKIPLVEPLPSQLCCTSDRWLDSTSILPLTFPHHLIPHCDASMTDVLEQKFE
ncbi:activating signal cointegrator 1 complex subunit 3-like [Myzus persicae]|uniref:activating signal cointegrator 1 complex subunit 3-like n=1 Tax=Myzus persicae TaxID=13164 RepID=UPI000B93960A|nr:activating signal cointegrator 1 complex subunit 3-like [Myzus persicae]XP_022167448.1 activating signal cointegrator 1 complex subunit 3-like [Myzus persicae]